MKLREKTSPSYTLSNQLHGILVVSQPEHLMVDALRQARGKAIHTAITSFARNSLHLAGVEKVVITVTPAKAGVQKAL